MHLVCTLLKKSADELLCRCGCNKRRRDTVKLPDLIFENQQSYRSDIFRINYVKVTDADAAIGYCFGINSATFSETYYY